LMNPRCGSMNVELYRHDVAFGEIFGFANTRFDWHNVAAILGKQGRLPRGGADPNMDWNHAPAICHDARYGSQVVALLGWNGHEVPWGWAFPEPDRAVEFDVHSFSLSHPTAVSAAW
jgi:hypothetical protein